MQRKTNFVMILLVGLMVSLISACTLSFDPADNPAKEVVLSGFVWLDENENGLQERGEEGLLNVDVQIRPSDVEEGAPQVYKARTDAFGKYEFYNYENSKLPETQYEIIFIPPANKTFTTQNAGDDKIDSDVNRETGSAVATLGIKIDAGLVPVEVAEVEPVPVEDPHEEPPGGSTVDDPPGGAEGEADPEGGDPGDDDAPPGPAVGTTTLCEDHTLALANGPEWYSTLNPTLTVKNNFLIFSMNTESIPDDQPFCGGFDAYSDDLPQLPLIEGCANCEQTAVSGVVCRDDLGNFSIRTGYSRETGRFVFWYSAAKPDVAEDTLTMSIPLDELIGQLDWWRLTGSDMNTCWAPSDYALNNGFVPSSEVSPELGEGMAGFDFNRICTDFVCFSAPAGAVLTEAGQGTWTMEVDGFTGNLGATLTPGNFNDRKNEFENSGWSFGGNGFVPEASFLPFQGNVMQATGLTYGPIAGAEVGSPESPYVLSFYYFGSNPLLPASEGAVFEAFGSILSSANLVVPAE